MGVPSDRGRGARGARGRCSRRALCRRRGLRREHGARSVAPFSSTGLALDGGARPELAAPGVGLVTSVPGRSEGAPRATGRSAARARPPRWRRRRRAPCRRPSGSRRRRAARRAGGDRAPSGRRRPGNVDLEAASAVELVADPPVAALGALDAAGTPATGTVAAQRLAQALVVRLRRGSATTSVTVTTSRERVVLPPGESRTVRHGRGCRAGRAGRAHRRRTRIASSGPEAPIPWSVAVPVTRLPVVSRVRLSAASFRASDTRRPCSRSSPAGSTGRGSARSSCRWRCSTSSSTAARDGWGGSRVSATCCPAATRSASRDAAGGCAPAARRVRRPDRRDAGGRRPADERRRLLPPAVAALQSARRAKGANTR